jgi:hypothetical protein
MRLRAFLSGPVMRMSAHSTSSVWRFGSDPRHLMNKGTVDSIHEGHRQEPSEEHRSAPT